MWEGQKTSRDREGRENDFSLSLPTRLVREKERRGGGPNRAVRSTHTHTQISPACFQTQSTKKLRLFFFVVSLGKRSDSKLKIMMDKYSLSENYDFAEVEERGRGPAAHSAIAGASPFCIWPVTEFDR